MKRSEMVDRLVTFLDKRGYLRFGYGGDYLYPDETDAKFILNFLEDSGMLPPDTYLLNEPDHEWEDE